MGALCSTLRFIEHKGTAERSSRCIIWKEGGKHTLRGYALAYPLQRLARGSLTVPLEPPAWEEEPPCASRREPSG